MAMSSIDKLIINSPFEEPQQHWNYNRESRTFMLKEGRRPAGYLKASEQSKAFDDPGVFIPIPLVNQIRTRVKAWRESGYSGITGITKRLLEYWQNPEERENRQFFFCQMEAIETLIWLVEAPPAEKVGIVIPSDGGLFRRLCCKMATGTGKTIVMAMLISWQILNKVTYPQDTRFSKNIFIVAPGLTIKNRLQVLYPSGQNNYYDEFNVVPSSLRDKLRQGKVLVRNWHALNWDAEEKLAKKKGVDKRGAKSDEAYVREVLEEMASSQNLLVINDEAHHAWRIPSGIKIQGIEKEEVEEATKWIGGLDRIHRCRRILTCFDFSATPFVPSGKNNIEEFLFGWIVSDFGLNDAIESGLVKTPRVVIRDDSRQTKDYKSRLYHLYNDSEVKSDLNRKAQETEPLPDLVLNAYYLLGKDWLETSKLWKESRVKIPPVMITVANRTETAARVKHAFDYRKILIEELCVPEKILHIDSKVLEAAEAQEEPNKLEERIETSENEENQSPVKRTKQEQADDLRKKVDTIGRIGEPGEQIQKVISVGMLSEGWDARTVTHIMGLRAFTSQLLCEQVVGRGLRRTSYEINFKTGFFDPEYVNIFGVPFTFLPHESPDGPPPSPQPPRTKIEPVSEKKPFEISWPNVVRIEHTYTPELKLDMGKVKRIELNAAQTPMLAQMAPIVDGKPDVTKISEINLRELGEKFRMQKIIFEAARDIYDLMKPDWKASKDLLLANLIQLVEKFLMSNKIKITPRIFEEDEIRRRILITLNMSKIVRSLWEAIRFENTEQVIPVFDHDYPIRSTSNMREWHTAKPCEYTKRSHINFCVYDSGWEATEAFEIDRNPNVNAWVKNDHLGFEISYLFDGVIHKYWPDFIIRLSNGGHLILETKGLMTEKDKTKRKFLEEWVKAVNQDGRFGVWHFAFSRSPSDVADILERF